MDTYYNEEMLEKFDKFKQGCFLIFKKWQAFRLALDNNPELLTIYADEERTELEIYSMLRVLLSDIDDEINKINSKAVINMVAEMLYDFIQAYFHIEMEDQSEKFVARDIYELHGDIFFSQKCVYFEILKKADKDFKSNFSIDFPISKKSVQTRLLEANLEKMDIDDIEDEDGSVDEENKETTNEKGNDKRSKLIPDSDGFIEVKKSKGKKLNKDFDMDFDSNINYKKQDDNLPDADGFVEVKKNKKK